MQINRTKNASRNILFGSIMKMYQIIVPFIMRTIMIHFLGAEYLGLSSLFKSVLQVLNLAELGVGSAMIYSMYKPIVDDDTDTICALMNLYKKYYRIIGIIILIAGEILAPFIKYLVKADTVPSDINIYILYELNLGATVLTYWLYAYKNCLLNAFQRTDILSKITITSSTITYALQLIVIILLKNYYFYYVVVLGVGIINNLMTAFIVDRFFPNYQAKGNLPKSKIKEINQRVKDLFTSKIGGIIYDSADTIVISAFLGMTALAIYQNYLYLISSITAFIAIIFSSVTAGIGNSLVVETKQKNYNDFLNFTFIINWITGFCVACFLCLLQPFMELWMGKKLMLDFSMVVCFVVYFYVRQMNSLLNLYKDASGMWHEDRFRPLIAALTNLGLNLILVQYIGLYGILLSTVIAILFVGEPWLLWNLFTVVFEKKNLKSYLPKLFKYALFIFINGVLCYKVASLVIIDNLILVLLVRLIICTIISNAFFLIVYHRMKEFSNAVVLCNKMTKGKIKPLNKIASDMRKKNDSDR